MGISRQLVVKKRIYRETASNNDEKRVRDNSHHKNKNKKTRKKSYI